MTYLKKIVLYVYSERIEIFDGEKYKNELPTILLF